jgi:hypothetical protein
MGITEDTMTVESAKTIMSENDLKTETPEKPEGCTVMSEVTKKPVRLLYRNVRQFSLLVP